ASAAVRDVQRTAAETGHKRILVRTADGGAPGVVHVRDTLLEEPAAGVTDLARSAYVLTAQTSMLAALTGIRSESEQLAVVMDAGTFLGVVTSTDIMRRVLPRDGADPAPARESAQNPPN